MLRRDWPLVLNTLFAQAAAGLFLFLTINRLGLTPDIAAASATRQFSHLGLSIVGPVIVLAMLLSLFHLGQPFRAYRAMSNLPSSWLSWEILFSSAFFLFWLVCFLLERNAGANIYLWILTGLAGICTVVSMANIYAGTGRPGWKNALTYVAFLGSLMILGSVGATGLLSGTPDPSPLTVALGIKFNLLAVLLLVIDFILTFQSVARLTAGLQEESLDRLASSSEVDANLLSQYAKTAFAGCLATLLGLGLLFYCLRTLPAPVSSWWPAGAVLLVLCGEFLKRAAFMSLGPGQE